MKQKVASVLNVLSHPVHAIADCLHKVSPPACERKELSRRHRLRYLTGALLMVSGSAFAIILGSKVTSHSGHVFVDVVAYAVHGCGAVPYGRWLVTILALE